MRGIDHPYLTGEYPVSEVPTIPPGTYDATLDGVTEQEHQLFGQRWVWHWQIPAMGLDGDDFELQVWTPPRLSSTGMASEQAKALGATPTKGAMVDLGSLRGRRARLVVTLDEEKGRNRVRGVLPAATDAPQATADPDYTAWHAERQARVTGTPAAGDEEPPLPTDPPADEAAPIEG